MTQQPHGTPWVFRQRKYLPVPLVILGLCDVLWNGHPWPRGTPVRRLTDLAAVLLIVAGESMLIWGVGYIGRKSRSSDIHAARLITSGPYAHTRNPLYFGGFLLTLGLSALSGSVAIVLGCVLYWIIVYGPIIRAEERFLWRAFGRRYAAYCRAIPRWWPRLRPGPGAKRATWRWQELSKEYQTGAAILATALLMYASLFVADWFSHRRQGSRHDPIPPAGQSVRATRLANWMGH